MKKITPSFLGFVGRKKTVDFDATQINHAPRRNITNLLLMICDTDSYFKGNLSQGLFELITFRGRKMSENAHPQTYGGDQNITAGYISVNTIFQNPPEYKLVFDMKTLRKAYHGQQP